MRKSKTFALAAGAIFLLAPLSSGSKDLLPKSPSAPVPQKSSPAMPADLKKTAPKPPGMLPEHPAISSHQVRNHRTVPGGEEVEVVVTGKSLHRLTSVKVMRGATEVREIQAVSVSRTPTVWTLRLRGKGAALGSPDLRLRLSGSGPPLVILLGGELKKVRGVAGLKETTVAIPPEKQRALEKIKERERALETARPLDDEGYTSPPVVAPAPVEVRGTARLGISSIYRSTSEPLHVGASFPLRVTVLNESDFPADVYLSTVGDGPGLVERLSESVIVRPGWNEIGIRMTARPNRIRDGNLDTDIFLCDSRNSGTGLLDVLWKDDDKNNNTYRISFPLAPREIRVRLSMSEFRVESAGDGGRRDPGEFKRVYFSLCREGGGCSSSGFARSDRRRLSKFGRTADPLTATDGDIIFASFDVPSVNVIDTPNRDEWYWFESVAYEEDPPCIGGAPGPTGDIECGNTGRYRGNFKLSSVFPSARDDRLAEFSKSIPCVDDVNSIIERERTAERIDTPILIPLDARICLEPVY